MSNISPAPVAMTFNGTSLTSPFMHCPDEFEAFQNRALMLFFPSALMKHYPYPEKSMINNSGPLLYNLIAVEEKNLDDSYKDKEVDIISKYKHCIIEK